MAIDFPTSPTPGQIYTDSGRQWQWNDTTQTWEAVFSTFAPGPAGPTGFTGSIGFTGSQGSSGVQGFTGSQGGVGFTGSQGDTGFTGSLGFTGSAGLDSTVPGPQGNVGFTGSQGPQGPIGFTGSAGTGGGGGALWTFDTNVKFSNFIADPNTYYFFEPGGFGDFYVYLPSNPNDGDVVIVRSVTNDGGFVYFDDDGAGGTIEWDNAIRARLTTIAAQPYAGLVFNGNSGIWLLFMGALEDFQFPAST